MRLNEIHVHELGVLEDVSLVDIPGLSVIHGEHGSGKSTLVRFLRDTLMDTDAWQTRQRGDTTLGRIRVSDQHHRWSLTRVCSAAGQEGTVVDHLDDPHWSGAFGPAFPEWLTDQAIQEVLCPGHVEADRFALLVRLCLETGGQPGSVAEVQRAEEAIAQAIREREGTAQEAGVTQRISRLEQQRDALSAELERLGQHDPEVAAEIRSVEAGIDQLQRRHAEINRECERLQLQIAALEQQIAEFEERNRLALDQQQLRMLMSELTARRNRWRQIRESIERHAEEAPQSGVAALNRSSHSIRAVVSRLEQRMQESHSSHWRQVVEQETAALCRFVTQQQEASSACARSQEAQLSSDAAASIHRMESMLQDQIIAVQEELLTQIHGIMYMK